MSLSSFGAIPFLLGLAVIAGILFLLQRLQVRFREEEVVTTLFWKQAIEETRARMLIKRFRHPLSYLLALAIAGLIWLSLAGPDWNSKGKTDYVFLLDGSAGMDWGTRFEDSKVFLRQEVDRIPADQRRVYFCGADPRLILDRGEETSLLFPRLDSLSPEACPASIERIALDLASDETFAGELKVLVVGDAPFHQSALTLLPDRVTIERLRAENTPGLEKNNGISAIGVAEPASGTFGRVDMVVETLGEPAEGFSIALGGKIIEQPLNRDGDLFFLRDLPARGEVLEVALTGDLDQLKLDNSARILLPSKQSISVFVAENSDDRFLAIIDADPALVRASQSGDSALVQVGGESNGSTPAIELVAGNGIALVYEESLSDLDLETLSSRFSNTGLDRVGWKLEPASENAEAFRLLPRFVPGEARKVQIGVELMGPNYDFVQTSAFPLFVSAAIRWLADVDSLEPFALAGERLPEAGRLTLAGSDFAPPRAGRFTGPSGKGVEVSLSAVPVPGVDVLRQVSRSTDSVKWPGIFTWCVLIALLLALGEWWLFQRSRIP